MNAGPYVSVELDDATAVRAHRLLASRGAAAGSGAGPSGRTFALVDLGAEPPGWIALAAVADAAGADPVLTDLVVAATASGHGRERDLLDAVADRLRAGGARRLRLGAGLTLDL